LISDDEAEAASDLVIIVECILRLQPASHS